MTTVEQQTRSAIRPFRVHFPEETLADLRRRLAATRWPPREHVQDASQGVQTATMQALCRYWAADYDWRACEARLNTLPQFTTEIDGAEKVYPNLTYFHEAERGGHFAAWEEPEVFADELRAAFAPLRAPQIPQPRH